MADEQSVERRKIMEKFLREAMPFLKAHSLHSNELAHEIEEFLELGDGS